jgi:hypothetical protein
MVVTIVDRACSIPFDTFTSFDSTYVLKMSMADLISFELGLNPSLVTEDHYRECPPISVTHSSHLRTHFQGALMPRQ